MFFAPAAPPPVSWSREVAPILALHCNTCHGETGGLSTRSYAALMAGGDLGQVVVPGDPDRSLLVHFIEGRRGPEHRMPLGAAPLTADQIATIRRWIAEGAREDPDTTKKYVETIARVRARRGQPLRVLCRINTQAYLTVRAYDPRTGRTLFSDVAAINRASIHWDITPGRGWPKWIALELTIAYADEEPAVVFVLTNEAARF